MLRLPAVRGQLQFLAGRSESLESLCEAYEDASGTLERLLKAPGDDNCPMVKEYQAICGEIEAEVLTYCLQHRSGVLE
jgi:hypothetical protein